MPFFPSLPGEDSSWGEFKVNSGGDRLRKAGKAQPVKGLVGHVKNFGLYSEGNGASLKDFKLASDKVVE